MSGHRPFKGLELELHRFSGARIVRVIHPGPQVIEEHQHDWPYIGIYTAGHYRELYERGQADIHAPCAVLHPAGRPHADQVFGVGLETLNIEFDPDWLRTHGFAGKFDCSRVWSSGSVALNSRRLAVLLASRKPDESRVGESITRFLLAALRTRSIEPQPPWLDRARRSLLLNYKGFSTRAVARQLDLNPAYLARAYRRVTGEGIGEALRRRRVEIASAMLRNSCLPLADVAAAAYFCDQSHMNRCFLAVLGRTPLRVRQERQLFEQRLYA